jgi:hypothetical protein
VKHVEDIRSLMDLLLASDNFHSLVVEGAPGWGKSSSVERVLTDKNLKFTAIGSYTTPLRLFEILCENSSGVVVIDDCAGIFGDSIAMSILKAATWASSGTEGTRLVTWSSSSEKVRNNAFFFEGKIVLLANAIPVTGDGAAFTSRSLHYCITPSPVDMETLIWSVASSGHFSNLEVAQSVASLLLERAKTSDFRGVNLRTLQLGYELANSGQSNWKELYERILPSVLSGLVRQS